MKKPGIITIPVRTFENFLSKSLVVLRKSAGILRELYVLLRARANIVERISVIVYICTFTLFTILFIVNLLDLVSWIKSIVPLTVAVILILTRLLEHSTEIAMLSSISQYLLKGDRSLIDELLGKFITGKQKIAYSDPVEDFFTTLEDLSREGKYEIRRRISEALPTLFHWKQEKAESLAKIMRGDWDDKRGTDVRRRVVEAIPYLIKKNPEIVKCFLEIREKDEVYTAIAIAEVTHEWLKTENKEAVEFHRNFRSTIPKCYSTEECQGVIEVFELLKLIEKNKFDACQKMRELSKSKNMFVRIGVARNLYRIFDEFPEETFNLMEYFLRPGEHKFVRMPISKDTNIKVIYNALKDPRLRGRAKSVSWKLIKDSDKLIRIAAFDFIDDLETIDTKLCQDIVNHVVNTEEDKDLLRRARKTQEDLEKIAK